MAFPNISITGLSTLGSSSPLFVWDVMGQVADSLTLTRGNHLIKLGTDWTHVRVDFENFNYLAGSFSFSGEHSGLGLASAAAGRLAWADFLLDQADTVILGNVQLQQGFSPGSFARLRQWRWDSYITDDWKIAPKLTLNIGLRYEYDSVWQDIRGGSPNLNLATGTLFPPPGVKGDLYEPVRDMFGPRVGLAWRPFGGTTSVIRAGYGLYYNHNMVNQIAPQLALNPPFSSNIKQLNPAGSPLVDMHNADLASSIVGYGEELGIPRNFKLGDVHQWILSIQKALPGNMMMEVSYVGSKSSHFDRTTEYNMYIPGTLVRPNPTLGPVEFLTTDASGTYEGLLTKLEKRASAGLTFMQTYTWSHTLFDSLACCGAQRPSNPFNMRAEKGNAETDQRHRATSSVLYAVPWYKTRHDAVGKILGGWQINGIMIIETGLPMHPIQSIAPFDDGCPRCTSRRPDRIRDGNLSGDQRSVSRWFDTSAFVFAAGHYGNSGRNILRAPGLFSTDLSLFKNIPFRETNNLQIRWEAYNATNTPPFQFPTLDISSANFGRITSAGDGRVMQVGLRLQF
jgi:hypothetical protein